ncbi:MAG: Type topoisomerase, subunit [Rickettsiaceae bacterium]|jgi:DNA gyrase subunit A|nr:Type topoisomerase, subunit [Rickettsiaceae bacterium]
MTSSTNLDVVSKEIIPVAIEVEMKKSYLDYAMSVIVARAIPDACDGLKPVHRRILYAMYEGGYDYNKAFKKSARIVGEVMGKYHPHGDSAIYESLVRMAQDFSMRLPLIDGQGNFGSIDDDPAAAMRYTESRLKKVTHTMLEDLDKDTVDFIPNYDGSEKEPKVMPAKFPNLLVNGSGGIAVGMATNIPPHNLGETIDGCLAYIDNNDITIEDLIKIIPGPDFPTGGIILGRAGYDSAAKTGRGSVIMRGRHKIEKLKGGKISIVITEIPYQTNKAKLVEKIAELVKEKKIEGITDLRDESDRDGIRVVIELRKDAMEEVIINQLYSFTPLQSSFGVNMLALNHGRPELLNLLDVIKLFVAFRENVVARRTNFLLNKARDKTHILIGLAVAVANIDEIVDLIKKSPDAAVAKEKLLTKSWPSSTVEAIIKLVQDKGNVVKDGKFYFTELQAKAILDMRLARLTGLESGKISEELKNLAAEISEYLSLLANRTKLMQLVKDELVAIKEEFSTPRRSTIEESEFEVDVEDLIPKEDMVVVATMNGYIKRVALSAYRAQKRGGKGRSAMDVREEDFATDIFVTNTHTPILFFSSKGKVYKLKTYKLPLGSPQARGRALVNLLPIEQDEKISTILALPENEESWKDLSIIFATSNGDVRRNSMDQFTDIRSSGKIAMKLEGDEDLIGVNLCTEDSDILLSTKNGKCIRFPVSKLRIFQSRNSTGVRGIKLENGNKVIAMSVLKHSEADILVKEQYLKIPVEKRIELKEALVFNQNLITNPQDDLLQQPKALPEVTGTELKQDIIQNLAINEDFILTITKNGYGKRSSAYEYRITNRGGSGITNIITSKRNGDVVASFPIDNSDQVMIITDKGTLIRSDISTVRITGRNTQGVTLIKAKENESVVSVARIAHSGNKEVDDMEVGDGEEVEEASE